MLYKLSAKYCQENKERLQRKFLIYIKIFLKKKKKEKATTGRKCNKNFSEDEIQNLFRKKVFFKKKYYKFRKKQFIIIMGKYFNLEKFTSL